MDQNLLQQHESGEAHSRHCYNNHSYALSFVESVGFKRPSPPPGSPAPGHNLGNPTPKLSYFGTIKPK